MGGLFGILPTKDVFIWTICDEKRIKITLDPFFFFCIFTTHITWIKIPWVGDEKHTCSCFFLLHWEPPVPPMSVSGWCRIMPISPLSIWKKCQETDPGVTSDSVRFWQKESDWSLSAWTRANNSSKYNWRKRLSSHLDWYNNVSTTN